MPRPCSHSDTNGSASATALLQPSSQSASIPSSSVNQATTSIHSLSHSDKDIFPSIPSFSCVVNSPNVSVLDSTQSQISVGASFYVSPPPVTAVTPVSTTFGANTRHASPIMTNKKPFVLKLKTNHIKICQSCRKNYDGVNDTLGLVVARAERRLISNIATGVQFLAIRIITFTYHV